MSINTPRSFRSFFLSIRLRHKLIILVYEFLDVLDMSIIITIFRPSTCHRATAWHAAKPGFRCTSIARYA